MHCGALHSYLPISMCSLRCTRLRWLSPVAFSSSNQSVDSYLVRASEKQAKLPLKATLAFWYISFFALFSSSPFICFPYPNYSLWTLHVGDSHGLAKSSSTLITHLFLSVTYIYYGQRQQDGGAFQHQSLSPHQLLPYPSTVCRHVFRVHDAFALCNQVLPLFVLTIMICKRCLVLWYHCGRWSLIAKDVDTDLQLISSGVWDGWILVGQKAALSVSMDRLLYVQRAAWCWWEVQVWIASVWHDEHRY